MKEKLLPLSAGVAALAVIFATIWLARYHMQTVSTASGPVVIRLNRITGETEYARWRDNGFASWSKVY